MGGALAPTARGGPLHPKDGRLSLGFARVKGLVGHVAHHLLDHLHRCNEAPAEGARILEDGIAARSSDIDVIWTNGYGFPRHRGGPMHFADTIGLAEVYAKVCEFRDRFGAEFWEPPALLKDLAGKNQRFADFDKGSE